MEAVHTPITVENVADVYCFLVSDTLSDDLLFEVWGYDSEGNVGTLIDEQLFLTHYRGRVVLCVGTYAKDDFVEARGIDIEMRKRAEAKAAEDRERAIADARRTLRIYGVGLTD